jgi:hypothetical protein
VAGEFEQLAERVGNGSRGPSAVKVSRVIRGDRSASMRADIQLALVGCKRRAAGRAEDGLFLVVFAAFGAGAGRS